MNTRNYLESAGLLAELHTMDDLMTGNKTETVFKFYCNYRTCTKGASGKYGKLVGENKRASGMTQCPTCGFGLTTRKVNVEL